MCHQPCSIKAEEGEIEEGGAECGALQEVLGGGLREECDREECDVPGLLVEVQQMMEMLWRQYSMIPLMNNA